MKRDEDAELLKNATEPEELRRALVAATWEAGVMVALASEDRGILLSVAVAPPLSFGDDPGPAEAAIAEQLGAVQVAARQITRSASIGGAVRVATAAVAAGATGDPAKVGAAENVLTSSLRSLFAVAENYPQLRAVESFLQLQEQLTATEDKVEFARRFYNTSARDYDSALQTFPRNLLAGPFGFKAVAFFETAETDRDVPQVNFTVPSGPPAVAATSERSGPPPA